MTTHDEKITSLNNENNMFDAPPLPAIPHTPSKMDLKAEKAQKMGRRRSFIAAVFRK